MPSSGSGEAASDGWSGNLPPETATFVGRWDELAVLEGLLGPDGRRLVTLVGPGGVGKTRLALQAARRARSGYPDGVWLVELSWLHGSGMQGPDVVGLAVMEALRLGEQTARGVWDALIAWIADKRLLLVLDSCEHLLADSRTAVHMLSQAPHVRILATSRERLAIPGELCLETTPLPVTGRDDAVALFADRAAAARPGFALDAGNRPVAAALCHRLDGVPLAVELAAARLAELSLTELNQRLEDRPGGRFRTLASDDESREPARHRMLRTTIGWSHELCAPLERLLWARLSVFAGDFDADAAREVCAGGPLSSVQVPVLLDRLAEQSVVQRVHRTGAGRFRMLDTVREYGDDWLRELGEQDAVRLRHREYYRRLAREGCAEWNTHRQEWWVEWVRTEHFNLRAALDFCLDGPDRRAALEFAGTTGVLWRHCGRLLEAQHCLDRALAADPAPGRDLVRALWARGAVAVLQGDLDSVGTWALRCTEAARELGDPAALEAAACLTGNHLALSGRPAEVLDTLSTAARLPVRDDWLGSAQLQLRVIVAFAHRLCGHHDQAREAAEDIREECARRGERWMCAAADSLLAQIDLAQGNLTAAIHHAARAVAGHGALHNPAGVAAVLDTLAPAVAAHHDPRRAARLLGIGQRLWERAGRSQLNSPPLIAARRSCEQAVRAEVGARIYERAYEEGRAMSYDQGIAYAAQGTAPAG